MDREILADIAGKTNKLGLRFSFSSSSKLNSPKDLKAHLRSFVLFSICFVSRDLVSNLAQPSRAWSNPLEIPPLESWGEEAR